MRTILPALLTLAMLAACERHEERSAKPAVAIQSVTITHADTAYLGMVDFNVSFGDYEGAALELTWDAPGYPTQRLLEFTPRQNGWTTFTDRQSFVEGARISGVVYPCDADGELLPENGAMALLESNVDGSFGTDPAQQFLTGYTIQGRVTRTGPATHWSIEARADGIMVVIDGRSHWTPK